MEIREQVALAPYTTLGVGGPARWFAEAASVEDVRAALEFANARGAKIFVLGGGSNVLAADAGFDGLVLRVALRGVSVEGGSVNAAAGEDWDSLVSMAVDRGLAGWECLSGIPGTVGGTPVQNVGAYGQEIAQTVDSVEALDLTTGKTRQLRASECGFSYRQSRFNTVDAGRFLLLSVRYRLREDGRASVVYPELKKCFADDAAPALAEVRQAVLQLRRAKGMVLTPGDADSRSAGSFFKNPIVSVVLAEGVAAKVGDVGMPRFAADDGRVKLSAAWLVERAGFAKGFVKGRAGISSRHALALINCGGATAAELVALRDEIVAVVRDRFGVALEQEPVMLDAGAGSLPNNSPSNNSSF